MLPYWSLSGLVPRLCSPFSGQDDLFLFISVHSPPAASHCMENDGHAPVATTSQYYGSWLHFQLPLHLAPLPSLSLLFLKEAEVHLAVAGVFWSTCPLDLPMIHSFMILKNHSERPFLTFFFFFLSWLFKENYLSIWLHQVLVAALRILTASCGTFPCSALT